MTSAPRPFTSTKTSHYLTYTYTPGELNRFPHLQHAIGTIKDRLEQAISERSTTRNPYTQHFSRGTPFYTTIENLGATTDLAALQAEAAITPEEEQRVKTLQAEIEALKSNTPQAQLQVARARHEHLSTINHALTAIGRLDPGTLQAAQAELQQASARYEHASKEAFAGIPIPGVLQTEWRVFIEAGEAYLKSTNRDEYPTTDESCIYCRQQLAPAAASLLRGYREYCNNTFRIERDKAQRAVDTVAGPLLALSDANIANAITAIADANAALSSGLHEALHHLQTAQDRLRAHEPTDPTALVAISAAPARDIGALLQDTNALITTFQERATERTTALKMRETELTNLQARTALRGLLPRITQVRHAGTMGRQSTHSNPTIHGHSARPDRHCKGSERGSAQ